MVEKLKDSNGIAFGFKVVGRLTGSLFNTTATSTPTNVDQNWSFLGFGPTVHTDTLDGFDDIPL
jgi:hypothetical protein